MDFELSEGQKALQEEARAFAERELTGGYALRCELGSRYPSELHRKAGEQGLIGVHLPGEYGGRGAGLVGSVLVIEALCRQDPGLGMSISLCSLGSHITLGFGSEAQKASILPGVVAGRIVTGVAFTEPDHGSDITDVATTAVRDGDEFVIDGVKTLISNGQNARYITVLCKTDPSARPARQGLSLILVETDRPGFHATDLGAKMGLKMTSTSEITLEEVRVPVANLVGVENRGFYHTLGFLDVSRVEIAAQALGGAQAAFDRAVEQVKSRRQSGKRLADLQVIQHKVADMATRIEAARLLTYQAAWVHDRRGSNLMLASMAKLYAARTAVEVAEEAVQLFGGRGYFTENEVERIYRDLRVTEIYEGTREIQKNTIAAQLLGRESRAAESAGGH